MKQLRTWLILAVLIFPVSENPGRAQPSGPPSPRVVDLKASDNTLLKATYFPAGKPGPGVLLFHQSNRDRKSWDGVAQQLAAAGMNVLTVDGRGHGESGGNSGDAERWFRQDLDPVFDYLASQPEVNRHQTAGAHDRKYSKCQC